MEISGIQKIGEAFERYERVVGKDARTKRGVAIFDYLYRKGDRPNNIHISKMLRRFVRSGRIV